MQPALALNGICVPGRRLSVRLAISMSSEDAETINARQARRQAIIEASQRAAQRMQALQQQGSAPAGPAIQEPEREPDSEPQPEATFSTNGWRATEDHPSNRHRDLDEIRARLSRAPEGYKPYYNTGDGYLADLSADSTDRHWSNSDDGKTRPMETIDRQFGSRPDQVTERPYGQRKTVEPPKEPAKALDETSSAPQQRSTAPDAPPASVVAREANGGPLTEQATAGDLTAQERAAISRAVAGLVQYVQVVQSSGTPPASEIRVRLKQQLELVRDILVEDSKRAPPDHESPAQLGAVATNAPTMSSSAVAHLDASPQHVAVAPASAPQSVTSAPGATPLAPTNPPAAVASPTSAVTAPSVATSGMQAPARDSDLSLLALDAAGVAARIANIAPGFEKYVSKIEEYGCDGRFLASLTSDELDESLADIGVTERLQRRRIAFELGLWSHD